MYQLDLINSRGNYHIGHTQFHIPSGCNVTMDELVRVEIISEVDDSAGTGNVYRLSDLLDLESKLVLISGQRNEQSTSTNEDIDYFVEVINVLPN